MKVIFKNMIQAYSGKSDGLVYYYNRKFNRVIVRSLPTSVPTAQKTRFSLISANLKALELSPGYKSDLFLYTEYYTNRRENWKNPVSNWYNIFMKLMWKMSRDKGIDLLTLTRDRIESEDLPCRTVKQAVEAGLIPYVNGYEALTRQL